jgi:predicted nucleotidyltransferase component of viral defense system
MVQTATQVKEQEVKKDDLYVKTLAEIRKMIPANKFQEKENKSGVTFFGESKTRLMKMVETKKGLRIEFNVPVSKVTGLTVLSEEEAKAKHMGTCRWIYSGNNMDDVKKLVQEAIQKFEPKKRADAKDEKDKKDAPKQEAPKQEAKKEETPQTNRKLTEKEKAALKK